MRFFKTILIIKNIVAFVKAKKKRENAVPPEYPDVKHPAEFLVRW